MKKITIQLLMLAIIFVMAACDNDVKHAVASVDSPKFESSTPAVNATNVKSGLVKIEVTYDKNVFFATGDINLITISDDGIITDANVYGSSPTLTIMARLKKETTYTVTIPQGVVLGPNGSVAEPVTLSFTTMPIEKALANPASLPAVQKVYNYLRDNYETKVLSGAMAEVNWNTKEADRVFGLTKKYPAINCFDYVHLPFSASGGWINYDDISPVKNWWNSGGLVAAMWHWNVPKSEDLAPAAPALLWEGSQETGSWSGAVQLTEEGLFAKAKVGGKVKVATADVGAGAQGSFKNGSWSGIAPGLDYFDIAGDFELDITQNILDELQSGGLIVGGQNYTITSIALIPPVSSDDDNYAFYKKDTEFDADNATTEGTWENTVFNADLAKVAASLKQLQNEGIVVIWRPFHEAAGGWFWWGKSADSLKKLWIAMFDYFKAQGVNNLIWVWTSETKDADWYPGDQYVDIVGRDLYGQDANSCAAQYAVVNESYGNKMVALTECGTVGSLAGQWNAGARWSWFMPWYGNNGDGAPHATDAWWKEVMGLSYVITRDDLPGFN